MVAPSTISLRRYAATVRRRVQLALAAGWEALTEAHEAQAVQFVRSLHGRLGADEALARYFHEVAVPALMRETVRARALLTLGGELDAETPNEAEGPVLLRPDVWVDALRRRAQAVEAVTLACRLAASAAEEAIYLTHVRNAISVADALDGELAPDEGLMQYIRAFELPSVPAQIVFQRALAALAARDPLPDLAALLEPATARPARPAAVAAPVYGLRAIG